MSRIVSFKADDSETEELTAYAKARHFKNMPDFLRLKKTQLFQCFYGLRFISTFFDSSFQVRC